MDKKTKKEEKYDGWLVSNNIFKRALAVWGHMLIINIFVYIIIIIVSVAFVTLFPDNELNVESLEDACIKSCENNESCEYYYVDLETSECLHLTEDTVLDE